MIPNDLNILLSYINTKLRDEYNSLDCLCDRLDADSSEISKKLADIGYIYDEELNQFKLCEDDYAFREGDRL